MCRINSSLFIIARRVSCHHVPPGLHEPEAKKSKNGDGDRKIESAAVYIFSDDRLGVRVVALLFLAYFGRKRGIVWFRDRGKALLTDRRTDPAHHLQHAYFRARGGPGIIFGGFRVL